MLPEFWNFLVFALVTVGGSAWVLLSDNGPAWQWLLGHVLVFGSLSLGALRRLMFRLWFHRIDFRTPAHARSGTMINAELSLLPFETISGVHVTISFRELTFRGDGGLKVNNLTVDRLNRGAPLRGRREHLFRFSLPAPTPLGRYMHLGTEMQVSLWRFAGRFNPAIGMAATQLRSDGGWFLQLKVRRGVFVKVIERRIVLYRPGAELLVG